MQSDFQTLIDLFLSGKASNEQIIEIETLKKSNTHFANELEQEHILNALSKELANERMSKILGDAWDQKHKPQAYSFRKYIPFSIAASVLLSIAIGFGLSYLRKSDQVDGIAKAESQNQATQIDTNPQAEEITPSKIEDKAELKPVKKKISPQPQQSLQQVSIASLAPSAEQIKGFFSEEIQVRSTHSSKKQNEAIKLALNALELGDYAKVVDLLKDYSGENITKAKYLLCISYYQLGNYQQSLACIPYLEKSLVYETEAEWLDLINRYALGQDITKSLDAILEFNDHPYREKALLLKDSIKK